MHVRIDSEALSSPLAHASTARIVSQLAADDTHAAVLGAGGAAVLLGQTALRGEPRAVGYGGRAPHASAPRHVGSAGGTP